MFFLKQYTADNESRHYWYSNTEFADWWRWLTEKNPMFTNFFLNGGLVSILVSFVRLYEDNKAQKSLSKSGKKKN